MKKSEIDLMNLAEAATMLPIEERNEFIKKNFGDDEELIEHFTSLLQQKENQNQQSLESVDIQIGDYIGPYHLIDEIGHGGMGTVFLVEQKQPIQRRLALKVISLGMNTKDVLARFNQERQALALMSHPNVAAVYDAGITQTGRPYFVMEYVQGVAITKYANQHTLNIKQRVELVIQACKGIMHAHQKGIIHRDIKPGNILVAEVNNNPIVKIIDFGVAKSTQQKLSFDTVYTQIGSFIGTPYYSSPEQTKSNTQDIDTRSDVYSLGILLYELIVGCLPYDPNDFKGKSALEIQKIINDHNVPTPYTKLDSIHESHQLISEQRNSSINDIKKELRGDLSSIILHAVEKNRDRRYASTSAFEADLNRFLNGYAVEAQAPTLSYRLNKFISRNKLVVASIISIFLTLSIALVISMNLYLKAERQSVHAQAVSTLLSEVLVNADPNQKEFRDQITLKQVVNELENKLDNNTLLNGSDFDRAKELNMQASLQWSIRKQLGDVYVSVADFQSAKKNYLEAKKQLQKDEKSPSLKFIDLNFKLANVYSKLGQFEQSDSLFDQSKKLISPIDSIEKAKIYLDTNASYEEKGEIEKRIVFEKEKLQIAKQFFNENSEEYAWQLIKVAASIAQTADNERLDEVTELATKAKIISQNLTPRNIEIEFNASNLIVGRLASSSTPLKAVEEGLKFIGWSQEHFGRDHIKTIQAQLLLCYVYLWTNNPKEIIEITSKILPTLKNRVAEDHYLMQRVYRFRSGALSIMDRFEEALPIVKQALKTANEKLDNPEIIYYSMSLSNISYYLGNIELAIKSIQTAIAKDTNNKGWNRSVYLSELAQFYLVNNNFEAALTEADRSLEAFNKNVVAFKVKAWVAFYQKKNELAITHMQDAKQSFADNFGAQGENYMNTLSDLALMYLLTNQPEKALKVSEKITVNSTDSVISSAIKLTQLATQKLNGIDVDLQEVQDLYQHIKQKWHGITLQHSSARLAAQLAGLKIDNDLITNSEK